ncbi:DNA polymerase zeta catalytic subunit-like [Pyrus ussuriensis x Pyrus communis]|uniref:DNA polymerase zeta catalytic subunit-like n=1 Tax=Pyrus ussuriensis x Pyrus communis TaxID=2448454 RepID=A0A5N5ICR3_9ROSA|nr:DNA polymerase zeta catalytic subunit-like [Pyrus ussuriensis x Pyrus communis]
MIGNKIHLDMVVDNVPTTLPQGPQENHENHEEERNHFCTDRTGIDQREGDAVKVQPNSECSQDNSQISGLDGRSKPTPLSQIGFRDTASVGGGQQLTLLSIELKYLLAFALIQLECNIGDRFKQNQEEIFDLILGLMPSILSLAIQNDNDPIVEVHVLWHSKRKVLKGKILHSY